MIGQIDDDREPEQSENILATVFLFPFKAVGAVLAVPARQIRIAGGDTPAKAVRMTIDTTSPDTRRQGVYKLVEYDFAHRPPYTTRYEQMAKDDPDPTVRAAAIRASSRARDRHATPVFTAAFADSKESDLVRLEAAKGLANLPDPAAVPTLLKVIANPDDNRDVRVAATDALKYYRSLEVGRALGNCIADRDFAVAWQARRSLVYLTHKDFQMDRGAWLGYIAGPEKPLD